jgi:hypothetical protein
MGEPQEAVGTLPARGRITLRGLVSGVVGVGDSGIRGSCILVGDKFCAWLPHVGGLGLKVVGILLRDGTLRQLLDSQVKEYCDVQVGDWHLAKMQADVVLVDGVASSDVLDLAEAE